MRLCCSSFGVLTVIVVYFTIFHATKSDTAAAIASVMLVSIAMTAKNQKIMIKCENCQMCHWWHSL